MPEQTTTKHTRKAKRPRGETTKTREAALMRETARSEPATARQSRSSGVPNARGEEHSRGTRADR
jgi:hypothetical protein